MINQIINNFIDVVEEIPIYYNDGIEDNGCAADFIRGQIHFKENLLLALKIQNGQKENMGKNK